MEKNTRNRKLNPEGPSGTEGLCILFKGDELLFCLDDLFKEFLESRVIGCINILSWAKQLQLPANTQKDRLYFFAPVVMQ